jgi:hypothetical protein
MRRTIGSDNCIGMDCIGNNLDIDILTTNVITWRNNVAMISSTNFYSVTLDNRVSSDAD